MSAAVEQLARAVAEDDGAAVGRALDAGADPLDLILYPRPGVGKGDDDPAWFAAATLGAANAMRVMIERGLISIDLGDAVLRETALHRAVRGCHAAVVEMLLSAGADAGKRAADGVTPAGVTCHCTKAGALAERGCPARSLLAAAGV